MFMKDAVKNYHAKHTELIDSLRTELNRQLDAVHEKFPKFKKLVVRMSYHYNDQDYSWYVASYEPEINGHQIDDMKLNEYNKIRDIHAAIAPIIEPIPDNIFPLITNEKDFIWEAK